MSKAEVIVVAYNQAQLEERCLASVRRLTDLHHHKLKTIDNFQADKNLGALWNDLIASSECEYVCLLNSDAEPRTEGWLDKLVETADQTGADAVGPMTNKCGIAYQVGPASPNPQLYPCKTLSGFCLLLRKSAWERVKGFREDFSFYGQESNMLDRLDKMFVRKDVYVNHSAGASIKAFPERQAQDKALGMEQYKRNRSFDFSKKVLVLGAGPKNPFPLWRGIDQAVVELGREGMEVRNQLIDGMGEEAMREILEWEPDVVILVNTNHERILGWKKPLLDLKCPKCLWWNDLRSGYRKSVFKGMFDHVFLCYQDSPPPYEWKEWEKSTGAKIHYMPQGSVINNSLYMTNPMWNSLFIGNVQNLNGYHDDRWTFLEKFQPQVINATGREDRAIIESQSRRLYRQARFCWVLSPPVTGYNSLRLYNVLAYGGLAVVKKFPNLEKLFTAEHLIPFDEHEAEAILHEAAARTDLEKVRRAGWRRQQVKHTVLYRIQNIMSIALGGEDSFWGWL